MPFRWDETWHRLREWTNGQGPSERLAAQILLDAGYENLDPSHPLGGKDGGKDAVCFKESQPWIMVVYFPRGQQQFTVIKSKFVTDFAGVAKNGASGIAFVTNQELSLAERDQLCQAAGTTPVDLFHLERLTTVLDKPKMADVRRQFLGIDHSGPQPSAGWASVLPNGLTHLTNLELTTPNPLHRLIDLLTEYHSALERVHRANTNNIRITSLDEWRSCHPAVWESNSVRDETIRKLADPAKEWLSQIKCPYVYAEDFNLVEEVACVLSGFAVSPSPMAMPDVYSKVYSTEDELWQQWTIQGDGHTALGGLIARLKELTARAGQKWNPSQTSKVRGAEPGG